MDKKAMYKLSYGLFVVTTGNAYKANGCITNTAIQIASDPTKLGLAVNKANLTHDMMLYNKKFNLSVKTEKLIVRLFSDIFVIIDVFLNQNFR